MNADRILTEGGVPPFTVEPLQDSIQPPAWLLATGDVSGWRHGQSPIVPTVICFN